jgi:hypothetical protein
MKIEKVVYMDPTASAEWKTIDEVKTMTSAVCVAVGQVVHECPTFIRIAGSYSSYMDDVTQFADVNCIPKGCVLRRVTIHEENYSLEDYVEKNTNGKVTPIKPTKN